MRVDSLSLIVAILRTANHTIEQGLLHIKEAEAEVAHEPLEAGTGAEVDVTGAHIDGSVASGLNNISIDVGAMSVSQVANRLEVMLEAVVHSDQREFDQFRLPVDDALEVFHIDAPIAGHHNAKIEPVALLERLKMH